MTHTPHELVSDFPELADLIHKLKCDDMHFARLMDEYHEINRQVHRAESLVEPISQDAELDLRKKRAALKDQLYRALKKASEVA